MINVGGSSLGLVIALIGLLSALGLLASSICSFIALFKSTQVPAPVSHIVFYALQIAGALLLIVSSVIVFWQGWRLDPILQFAVFSHFVVILFLAIKEIVLTFDRCQS
jgi:hypothetical protein